MCQAAIGTLRATAAHGSTPESLSALLVPCSSTSSVLGAQQAFTPGLPVPATTQPISAKPHSASYQQ
jgi:hypothetical protein